MDALGTGSERNADKRGRGAADQTQRTRGSANQSQACDTKNQSRFTQGLVERERERGAQNPQGYAEGAASKVTCETLRGETIVGKYRKNKVVLRLRHFPAFSLSLCSSMTTAPLPFKFHRIQILECTYGWRPDLPPSPLPSPNLLPEFSCQLLLTELTNLNNKVL